MPDTIIIPAAAGMEALVVENSPIGSHEDPPDMEFAKTCVLRLPVIAWRGTHETLAMGMEPVFPAIPGGAPVLAYCLKLSDGKYLANDDTTVDEAGAINELATRLMWISPK